MVARLEQAHRQRNILVLVHELPQIRIEGFFFQFLPLQLFLLRSQVGQIPLWQLVTFETALRSEVPLHGTELSIPLATTIGAVYLQVVDDLESQKIFAKISLIDGLAAHGAARSPTMILAPFLNAATAEGVQAL